MVRNYLCRFAKVMSDFSVLMVALIIILLFLLVI